MYNSTVREKEKQLNNNPKGNPETLKSFPSKWSTPDTKVIRVPTYLAKRVMQYAKDLDSRKDKADRHVMTSADVRNMLGAIDALHHKFLHPRGGMSAARKAAMKQQLDVLMSLVPVDTRARPAESESQADA